MPRIRCHYEDCVFLEDGYCGAAAIELEPENGCLTYKRVDEAEDGQAAEEWEEEDLDDEGEEEGDDYYDDEDDDEPWDDEDEDY
ncbi:MAG: hypothetical protein IT317_19175 [Anaerolineales bacterium]|nr:hypothetical protein [Anaerolineales bacterium]